MLYTESPFKNPEDRTTKSHLRRGYRRINIRTINNIPVYGELVVRNGCPIQYKGGYLTPISSDHFASTQELNDFLHTAGRKGLFQITRFSNSWYVIKCIQMPSKKQALKRAAKAYFAWAYDWKKNELVHS